MITLPDELVYWQVKDAVKREAPNILVNIHGTHKDKMEFMESTAQYLAKKGVLVKIHTARGYLQVIPEGVHIRFSQWEHAGDLQDIYRHAGWHYQVVINNVPMTFDVNRPNDPIMYLMSRVRGTYEEK